MVLPRSEAVQQRRMVGYWDGSHRQGRPLTGSSNMRYKIIAVEGEGKTPIRCQRNGCRSLDASNSEGNAKMNLEKNTIVLVALWGLDGASHNALLQAKHLNSSEPEHIQRMRNQLRLSRRHLLMLVSFHLLAVVLVQCFIADSAWRYQRFGVQILAGGNYRDITWGKVQVGEKGKHLSFKPTHWGDQGKPSLGMWQFWAVKTAHRGGPTEKHRGTSRKNGQAEAGLVARIVVGT